MRENGAFSHVFSAGGNAFVSNQSGHLTGFCSPSIRGIGGGLYRLDYEIVITTIQGGSDVVGILSRNIENLRYLALPVTIDPKHSLDMIIRSGKVSEWMIDHMSESMLKYTLSCQDALSLIDSNADKFLRNLQTVFGQKFDNIIVKPLRKMCQ
jgi:hypothetical protein